MYDDLFGTPFVDGGRDPRTGLDCYGLVLEVFRRHGLTLPDFTVSCDDSPGIHAIVDAERACFRRCEGTPPVPSVVVIKLLSDGLCNHTGVYVGDGEFLHIMRKRGVTRARLDDVVWRHRIEGIYCVKGGQSLG